jgi:hypothetical protein
MRIVATARYIDKDVQRNEGSRPNVAMDNPLQLINTTLPEVTHGLEAIENITLPTNSIQNNWLLTPPTHNPIFQREDTIKVLPERDAAWTQARNYGSSTLFVFKPRSPFQSDMSDSSRFGQWDGVVAQPPEIITDLHNLRDTQSMFRPIRPRLG